MFIHVTFKDCVHPIVGGVVGSIVGKFNPLCVVLSIIILLQAWCHATLKFQSKLAGSTFGHVNGLIT